MTLVEAHRTGRYYRRISKLGPEHADHYYRLDRVNIMLFSMEDILAEDYELQSEVIDPIDQIRQTLTEIHFLSLDEGHLTHGDLSGHLTHISEMLTKLEEGECY